MTDPMHVTARRWLRWSRQQLGQPVPPLAFPEAACGLTIRFLSEQPEHVETVARWLYEEWSEPRGETIIVRRRQLQLQLNSIRLPIALIALWNGQPAGTVSLRPSDLRTRPRATPWLSALYVDPAHRGKGIGRELVWATQALAQWLGYSRVYLFTPDRQSFYQELGWIHAPRLPEEERHQPPSDVFFTELD